MQQGTKSPRTSPTFIPPELRKNVDDEANRLDRELKARGITTVPHREGQPDNTQINQQSMWQNTVPYVQAPQPERDGMMPQGFDAHTAINSFRTQPQVASSEQLHYQQQPVNPHPVQPGVTAGQHFPVPPSIWNGYDLPPEHKIVLDDDSELDQLMQSPWSQEVQVQGADNYHTSVETVPTHHETQPDEHQRYVDAARAAAFVEQPTPEIKIPRTIADFLNLGEWVIYARTDELRMRQIESSEQ